MTTSFVQTLRRPTPWTTLLCLLILALALAACGGDAGTSSAGSASSAGSPTAVTITEKTGGNDVYAFDPVTITIKAGGALKFVNNSDENHQLAANPTGPTVGTVTKSGSNDNTLTVNFPTAGSYTITSMLVDRLKDGKHTPDPADSKATIAVTVQ